MDTTPAAQTPSTKPASGPGNGDLALDNALIMLSALRKIGTVSGVPFLGEAALVAVRLVNLVKVSGGLMVLRCSTVVTLTFGLDSDSIAYCRISEIIKMLFGCLVSTRAS